MKLNTRFCLPEPTKGETVITALIKGEERYIFVWNEASRENVLRTFGKFASNPELSLTWYDAAVLSTRVRNGDTECQGR